ncbi:hypothetical protein C2S53_006450 [Perilla frutescens var. hirtella]|uniref:F-box domain-containing protein n=1 Tax=Perilla frutescens var. hirtella TaxID=608512 RepID=A0AAD4JF44_PERFH|nr:hypothetical protein C2S53_006450 [Perilla frutescens var. hirtella]
MEELPEEVLRCVVSFLPLKEAVRTSLLSTAWRSLWRPCIVNMDMNSDHIMQVIGKFLKSCDVHGLLRLSCQIIDDDSSCRRLKMRQNWHVLAAKGVEKELYLDFYNDERETDVNYSLKLNAIMNLSTGVASFASLKNLHLKSVTRTFMELSSTLFSNCLLLEHLKLEQCQGLESLDITASGRLEDLTVMDCPDMAEISISSLSLKSFSYRGLLPRIKMKNSSSLVDVTLDMVEGLGHDEFDCEELLSLLASLRNVETLNVTGWLLEWLCSAGVIFQRLDVRFNKLLQLRVLEPCMKRTKLDSLACFLEICPSLEKLYIDIDRERKDVVCPYFYEFWHEPYLGLDCSILKAKSPCRLECLRVVEVTGLEMEEYGLGLLHLLLKRALMLSSMLVKFRDDIPRRLIKLPFTQINNASRNNKQKFMIVVSPNKDYYLQFNQI